MIHLKNNNSDDGLDNFPPIQLDDYLYLIISDYTIESRFLGLKNPIEGQSESELKENYSIKAQIYCNVKTTSDLCDYYLKDYFRDIIEMGNNKDWSYKSANLFYHAEKDRIIFTFTANVEKLRFSYEEFNIKSVISRIPNILRVKKYEGKKQILLNEFDNQILKEIYREEE